MSVKSVSVIGLGYIGLPTATLIANNGFQVYGMDPVEKVVETINQGKIHIVEPGLEELVKKAESWWRMYALMRRMCSFWQCLRLSREKRCRICLMWKLRQGK